LESVPVPKGVAIPPVNHKSEELESAGYGVSKLSESQMEAKARIFQRRNEILAKQHRKDSYPEIKKMFPPGQKVYINQLALQQKGIAEYRFREKVKAELIPQWTPAIYTVKRVIPETVRVELEEFPKHSFYPYQLKPAAENLVKHGSAGTCAWERPRKPKEEPAGIGPSSNPIDIPPRTSPKAGETISRPTTRSQTNPKRNASTKGRSLPRYLQAAGYV